MNLIENITEQKIQEVYKNIDQDLNGQIDYMEFLSHSLTEKQLSEMNLKLFFDSMLSQDENTEDKDLIDSELIHKFFIKCGKIIDLQKLKNLMTDCGKKLQITEFDGEQKISFETFQKMMRFLLERS